MPESLRAKCRGGQWLKRQYFVIFAAIEGLGTTGMPVFAILDA